MIDAHAISLPNDPPYCLHEDDHLHNKRSFWDKVEILPIM
jgi:hypothetical protein